MRHSNDAQRPHAAPPRAPAIAAIVALLAALVGPGRGIAQEGTPDAGFPAPDAATSQAEAPAAAAPANEIDPVAPHVQAIAQGLVALDGDFVWRVREVTPPPAVEAEAETGGAAFLLQRGGASIVRNEVTGRRARLEPGEAFFMSADDPYVRSAAGDGSSTAWVIELVAPDARAAQGLAAGRVLFTSDVIGDYPRGTFDAELLRGVLLPGEAVELPPRTDPALIMVTSGQLQVSVDGAAPTALDAGRGNLVSGDLAIRNDGGEAAAFVVAAIGGLVDEPAAPARAPDAEPTATVEPDEETAEAGEDSAATEEAASAPDDTADAAAEPTAAPPAADVAPTDTDTDGDGLSDDDEAALGSDPLNADYDADGLLDGPEVNQYGTDPLNNDTDFDSLGDGEEVNQYGTNPVSADGDGDGLGDADELFVHGTDPTALDSDGDGVPDGEEVLTYGTDPLDPASGP